MPEPTILQADIFLWREWKVNTERSEHKTGVFSHTVECQHFLQSVFAGDKYVWRDKVARSECSLASHVDTEPIPGLSCNCGFWGHATLDDMMTATNGGNSNAPVFGLIRVFGNFVWHEHGIRAEYAKPELLIINDKDLAAIEEFADPQAAVSLASEFAALYDCTVAHDTMSSFYEAQSKLATVYDEFASDPSAPRPAADQVLYPCIKPPVLVKQFVIPNAEVDVEAIDWTEKVDHVINRPSYRTWNRVARGGAGEGS